MIAKISSGSSFYGAANYNQQKVNTGQANILEYRGLVNANPRTIDQTLNSLNNSRTIKPVFHASLSFSPKDSPNLNDKKMVEITKDYMKQMGYAKQPYVIYRHHDTKHPHVHVLTTRVDVNKGKRIPSFNEGIKSKAITEKLEVKYGLTIAQNQNIKLQKEIVRDVKTALQNYKPESVRALNNALSEMGSNYRTKAIKSGGIYYKVDDKNNRRSLSFKSSNSKFRNTQLFYPNLQKALENNKETRLKVAKKVTLGLGNNRGISLTKFVRQLQLNSINPIYYKNDKGIYDIAYNYKGHTYNGNELHPNLAYDKIQKQLQIPNVRELQIREAFQERLQNGQKLPTKVGLFEDYKTGNLVLDKYLNDLSKYEAEKVVSSFNQSIRETSQPNANVSEIQHQFEGKLTQLQQELEIGRQRHMSLRIGR